MNNGGYVCIWRAILEAPIWRQGTHEQHTLLMYLLIRACWKPTKYDVLGKEITLNPGQFFTSTRRISEETAISHQRVRGALHRFEKLDFLTQETTRRGTVITILNWGKYQDKDLDITRKLTREQHTDNTPITHQQHTDNTPIKEPHNHITTEPHNHIVNTDRENRAVNTVTQDHTQDTHTMSLKNNSSDARTGTAILDKERSKARPRCVEEVAEYFSERGYPFNHGEEAERFFDYYTANGWRVGRSVMKDWKSAARNWARNVGKYGSKGECRARPTIADYAEAFRKENERRGDNGFTESNSSDVWGL